MTGPILRAVIIVSVTIVTYVRGYDHVDSLDNSISSMDGGASVEFYISSNALNWKRSNDYCNNHGYQLASLDDPDERAALVYALRYKHFRDGTKFWIYTDYYGRNCYKRECCTEVSYSRTAGLKVNRLSGADCSVQKRYICES